jgi:hypothetical protein
VDLARPCFGKALSDIFEELVVTHTFRMSLEQGDDKMDGLPPSESQVSGHNFFSTFLLFQVGRIGVK